MITATQLQNFVTSSLSNDELTMVINAALIDIQRYYPESPDDAYRDMQIVDWAKNHIAYNGVFGLTIPGYTAQYLNRKDEIASSRRKPGDLGLYDAEVD